MNAFVLHALSRIDEPLYSMLRRTSDVWQLMRKPERPVRMGGLNPGRTFYLIGGFNHDVGLASWFDRALGYIVRAERKGWIPVIDCPVNKFGQSWDMYFKQPAGVSPEEARDSQNVVIVNDALEMIYKRLSARNIAVRNAAIEKYIRLQPRMQTFIDNALPGFIRGGGAIGAYLRGTDYRASGSYRPVGHSIVPDVGFFAQRLENDAAKWGVPLGRGERLFLVTEEQELLDGLIARFPDAKHVAKERFSCFKPGVSLPQRTLLHTTMEENNMLYLLDLYALSRCDYLVGPMNGGMQMALNLNGNRYKAVDIIDIGTY